MPAPLLEVNNLSKQFHSHRQILHAVQGVSFSLAKGEILGIGGESGSGKSTLGKMLMGLVPSSGGKAFFEGEDLSLLLSRSSKEWRKRMQMIFQHPAASLNPRMNVQRTLEEPFRIHGWEKGTDKQKLLIGLLEQVGLGEAFFPRMPHALSGGQKQRVAIARALALNPSLIICDEPFSALDAPIQLQIIQLLMRLQTERQLSYLIISHDLSILRAMTQRLLILYRGQMMELGPSEELYSRPLHPYTQALISAVLPLVPARGHRTHIVVKEDPTSQMSAPSGCPFYQRCPFAKEICKMVKPAWKEVKPGHFTACHLY